MKKLVVAGRGDRLGARIKNALAGHDFAKRIGADFILAWDPADQVDVVDASFSELFDIKRFSSATGIVVVECDSKTASIREGKSSRNVITEFEKMSDEEILAAPQRVINYRMTKSHPAVDPDVFSRMAEDFRSWPLNPRVQECVGQLPMTGDRSEWMAVHVRWGDIVDALLDPVSAYKGRGSPLENRIRNFVARYAPLSTYLEAIRTLHPDGKLALFSDDEDGIAALSSRVLNRSTVIGELLKPLKVSPAQSALAEFCMLLQFSKVLGGISAFSRVPAELSGATFIDVRKFITAEQILIEIEEIAARSKATNKDEMAAALKSAYAWYFKMEGKMEEFEAIKLG